MKASTEGEYQETHEMVHVWCQSVMRGTGLKVLFPPWAYSPVNLHLKMFKVKLQCHTGFELTCSTVMGEWHVSWKSPHKTIWHRRNLQGEVLTIFGIAGLFLIHGCCKIVLGTPKKSEISYIAEKTPFQSRAHKNAKPELRILNTGSMQRLVFYFNSSSHNLVKG